MSYALVRVVTSPATRPTVSAIVPTKNRPTLLGVAVRSLLEQTVSVNELIVVDQSDSDAGRRLVTALVAELPAARRPRLDYVLDPTINGAAAARNAGLDRAGGDILLCCDDDVVADPRVVGSLLTHYAVAPEWLRRSCLVGDVKRWQRGLRSGTGRQTPVGQ